MNAFSQARKDIKFISSTMRGLLALDEMLAQGADIEKIVAAKQAEVQAHEGAIDKAKAALDDVNAQIKERTSERDKLVSDAANVLAAQDKKIKDAEARAAARTAAADKYFGETLAKAKEYLAGKKAEADAEFKACQGDLAKFRVEISKEEDRLIAIKAEQAALLKRFGG